MTSLKLWIFSCFCFLIVLVVSVQSDSTAENALQALEDDCGVLGAAHGHTVSGSSCFYRKSSTDSGYTAAATLCAADGGRLPHFYSEDALTPIATWLQGLVIPTQEIWLGAKSSGGSGSDFLATVHWMDGSSPKPKSFQERHMFMTDNTLLGIGDCLTLDITTSPSRLNRVYCDYPKNYICEKTTGVQKYSLDLKDQVATTYTAIDEKTGLTGVRECAFNCLINGNCIQFQWTEANTRCKLFHQKSHSQTPVAEVGTNTYNRVL